MAEKKRFEKLNEVCKITAALNGWYVVEFEKKLVAEFVAGRVKTERKLSEYVARSQRRNLSKNKIYLPGQPYRNIVVGSKKFVVSRTLITYFEGYVDHLLENLGKERAPEYAGIS